jgi:hypothetical protein
MHPTVRLWRNLQLNTKLRNLGVRPGPHLVSPRAVSGVWGCRPPSVIMLSSISRRLFQEPCMLGGHLAGLFPPILLPSPPLFKPFFHLCFPHDAEQKKTKEMLNYLWATSAAALLNSLPQQQQPRNTQQRRPPPAFATTSTETIDFSIGFGFAALIYVSL